MNMLAIDCCLRLTGVALMTNEKIFYSQKDLGRLQSSELPKMTEKILTENNLSFNDINYIAVTNGPGYFTGIRVGAAYASGLAYAAGAKIIQVSSLEMLSYTFKKNSENEKILALIYAGHGFVYGECKNFLDAGEYSHEFIKSWIEKNPDAKIISDDPERTGINELKIESVKPDLISLCGLAKMKINEAVNPMELKISYYRAPQGVS